MIEAISSLAMIGSGAYLYLKGKSDGNTTSNDSGVKNDNTQKIIDSHKGGDTTTNTNDSYNARGEVSLNDNELNTSAKNEMYFGSSGEYDQFYDYTDDPVVSSLTLKNSSAVANEHALSFRCRLLSPFMAESEERTTKGVYIASNSPYTTNIGNLYWSYLDKERNTSQYQGSNGLAPYREFFRGGYRYYAFVLEVFNPYNIKSNLKQIVIDDVEIGGEYCSVFNDFGFCHTANSKQMLVNKHVLDDKTKKINHVPYIMNVSIEIQPQDSVLIPIVLPLAKISRKDTINITDNNLYVLAKRSRYSSSDALPAFSIFAIEHGLCFDYESDGKQYSWKDDLSVIADDFDKRTCEYYTRFDLTAPPSLKDHNIKMKVTLSSGAGNYTFENNNGKATIMTGVSSHILEMIHSNRLGYDNWDDYKKSYVGDAVPTLVDKNLHVNGIIDALADDIFKINKGYPIEDGFPSQTGLSYEPYEFTNDPTHDNLG